MTKVTVITASYNHADYLKEAIECVLNQTFKDFTYLIWDDGSSDISREIIKEYADKDSRIQFYTHENQVNKGLPDTIKACVEKVESPYLAFLESDDKWHPEFLSSFYDIAQRRVNMKFFFCDLESFGDKYMMSTHSKMLAKRKHLIQTYSKKGCLDLSIMLFANPISTMSSVFARSELIKQCQFDTPIAPMCDVFLYCQLLEIGRTLMFLDKKLLYWRKHKLSYSSSNAKHTREDARNMVFDIIYPENTVSDRSFVNKLMRSKLEKAFRPCIKYLLCLYLKYKYGRKNIIVYSEN